MAKVTKSKNEKSTVAGSVSDSEALVDNNENKEHPEVSKLKSQLAVKDDTLALLRGDVKRLESELGELKKTTSSKKVPERLEGTYAVLEGERREVVVVETVKQLSEMLKKKEVLEDSYAVVLKQK